MIGFNVMNGSTMAGAIIWNDKRNGMFQQLLVMPFSKAQYIISNLITIILIGLASAAAFMIIGLPTMYEDVKITLWGIPYCLCISDRLDILWFFYNNLINKDQE